MSHEEIKKLISAYIDGEVSDREKKQVQDHLSRCAECRQEFRELTALEEVLHNMKLKQPSKDIWDVYWSSVYNRLERKIGWIVLSLGLIILIGVGAFPAIKDLILNPEIPLVLKVGLLIFSAGGIIVFVSILREQLFFWKRERYKEVKK
jgi:predicted anti-sigma-YlaC factor YlaD